MTQISTQSIFFQCNPSDAKVRQILNLILAFCEKCLKMFTFKNFVESNFELITSFSRVIGVKTQLITHFKNNTKRCEWGACWWSKCVDKKSFQGPKAFSRHKSRQQKAFTTLTQNETKLFLGLENDFAPFDKYEMQYWTWFYYSIIFLRLVATQILEFNEMPQNWASRPNYSRLTVTAEKHL